VNAPKRGRRARPVDALLCCCFAAFSLLIPACAHAPRSTSPAGTLLIVGGGLHDDNEAVWGAFVEAVGPEPHIGILPTASALPDAGESTADHLRTLLPDATIDLIDIRHDSPQRALDPAYAARIEACSALWFTGGDQSRITAVFRPSSGDTPACEAARRVLARGGLIAGTSAGAAMMSDPMITGGDAREALLQGARASEDEPGVGIGRGMGFFPYGLTDQHFLRRGRLGRLIAALHETGTPRGYGVDENCAVLVDLATNTIRPIGRDALLLVNISHSTRTEAGIRNVRLSLLSDGDEVDGRTGRIRRSRRGAPDAASSAFSKPPTDPFAREAIGRAIHAARARPGEPLRLAGETGQIQLTFTAEHPDAPVRLDIVTASTPR
jgi:cyanophycinase